MPISQPVINGGFDIWQRGTSIAGAASATYAADRWQMVGNTASTCSRQATGDTTNLPFIQYAARVQRTNGSTSTTRQSIVTSLESANSIPYAGRTITWSFYARRGANFSATSNLLGTGFYTGTGTDQNILTGFTGLADTYGTFTLTTSWQRFTQTVNVGATATQIALQFYYDPPAGTAGANDWFEVTGVQIDLGSSPLAFRRSGDTLAGELAACQRYYYRQSSNSSNAYAGFAFGTATATTTVDIPYKLAQTMRIAPTLTDFANLAVSADNSTLIAVTNLAIVSTENSADSPIVRATVTGATQFRPYGLFANNNTNAYVGFSAEL